MGVIPESSAVRPAEPARPDEAALLRAVEECRRVLTLTVLSRRMLYVGAGAALVPLLAIIGDHQWSGGLPRWVLASLLAAWTIGLTGGVLGGVAATYRRRFNRVYAGRCLERACGIRHNSIVNALLLRDGGLAAYAEDAAVRQATRDLTAHPALESVTPGRPWLAPVALLAAVAAWGLYSAGSPKPIGPSLARFFGANVKAPAATWLELLRPAAGEVVHAGEALTVEIGVHGRSAAEVRFDVLDPGDETGTTIRTSVPAEPVGERGDHWRLVLPPFGVQGDIHYRCVAGEGRLDGVIPVQPQPDVEAVEILLEPPAYTGWASRMATGPDLDVLAGTQATFALRANVPIRDPVFVFRGESELRTRMDAGDGTRRTATLTMRLTQSGAYHIEFCDRWGYPCRNPARRRLEVRPDRPPAVSIVLPAEGQVPGDVVDVSQFPELVAVAEDDVGVSEVALVMQVGDASQRAGVTTGGAANGPRVTGRVPTAGLPVRIGQKVQAWFEAADGRVLLDGHPAPQLAKSRVLTLVRSGKPPTTEPAPEQAVASQPAEKRDRPAAKRGGQRGTRSGDGAPTDDGSAKDEPPGGADAPPPPETQPGEGSGESEEHESAAKPPEQPPTSAPAANTGEGTGEEKREGGSTPSGKLGGELKRFVREHGEEARKAREAARGPANPESQPSEGAKPQPATQPASGEGGGGNEGPNAESQPAEGADASPEGGEPARAGEGGDGSKMPGGGAATGNGETSEGGAQGPTSAPAPPRDVPRGEPDEGETTGMLETLDLLEMEARGEGVTEDMLINVGWPPEQAAAFVRAIKRLHAAAQEAGGLERVRRLLFDTRLGEQERQAGRGLSAEVDREVGPVEARQDGLARIAPPAGESVPEDLEALLEAYYRALAAERAREK